MSVLATFALLAASGGMHEPTILIMERRPRSSLTRMVANIVQDKLLKRFPCATVTTTGDIATLLDYEKGRQLMGVGDDEFLSKLSNSMNADLIVTVDVDDASGAASASTLDPGRARATDRVSRRVDPMKHADVAALADDIYRGVSDVELCPPVGTIEYTRDVNEDSTAKDERKESDGSGREITTTEIHHTRTKIKETWLIRIDRGRGLGRVVVRPASGRLEAEFVDELTTIVRGGLCRPSKDGTVNDAEALVAQDMTVYAGSTSTAQATQLTDIRYDLVIGSDKTYTISLQGTVSGESTGKGRETKSGACGSFTRPDDGRAAFGGVIGFTSRAWRLAPGRSISGSETLTSGKETVRVKWDLER